MNTYFKRFTPINTAIFLLLIFFLCLSFSLEASAQENNKNSLILLLNGNNGMSTNIIKDNIEDEFPNVDITPIKEINSIILNNIHSNQIDPLKKYIEKDLAIAPNAIANDVKVNVPDQKTDTFANNIKAYSSVNRVNDSSLYDSILWDIKQVTNDFQSYTINEGSHHTKVGILDSGIDFNHPDLKQNIISSGESFIPGDSSTKDTFGHGTMVAGTIAANGELKGVSPNIGLVPYKVVDENGGQSSWVIEAIVQSTKDDMDVINLSLSTFKSLKDKEDRNIIKAYERAFRYARENNTVVVASAGNDSFNISNPKQLAIQMGDSNNVFKSVPSGMKNVITVSGTTKEKSLSSYSNYGKNISISAPSGDYGPYFKDKQVVDLDSWVLTTYPTNLPQTNLSKSVGLNPGYELTLGTSVASPKVTAAVALVKDEYFKKHKKTLSNKEVEKIIYNTSEKPDGYNKEFLGSGIVNVYKALSYIDRN
ncbi:S8 family serine peptidase [Bacillus sp. T_4]|nr:S8 family serine peptidase [Bacillus sp. T_4]